MVKGPLSTIVAFAVSLDRLQAAQNMQSDF